MIIIVTDAYNVLRLLYPSEDAAKQLESWKQLMAKEEQEAFVGKFVETFKCKHVRSQKGGKLVGISALWNSPCAL